MPALSGIERLSERGPWESFAPIRPFHVAQGLIEWFCHVLAQGLIGLGVVLGLALLCALVLAIWSPRCRREIFIDAPAALRAYRRDRRQALDAFEWRGRIFYQPPWEAEHRATMLWGGLGAMLLIGSLRAPEGVLLMGLCGLSVLWAWVTPKWRAVEPPDYRKLIEAFQVFCLFAEIDHRLVPDKLWRAMALQGAVAYRRAYMLTDGDHHRRHAFAVRVMTAEINKMTFAVKTYLVDGRYLADDGVHQMLFRLGVEPPYGALRAA